MERGYDTSALRYVEASRVQSPAGELSAVDLRNCDDQKIGSLDGLLVDPVERRLCYFVVKSSGWTGSRRYLVPTDWPVQMDPGGRALRLDFDPDEFSRCEEFKRSSVPCYSDDDLLASMFRERIA